MNKKMGKRTKRLLKGILALSMAAAMIVPISAWADDAQLTDLAKQEVEQLISKYHVSGISDDRLQGKDVDAMLKELNDPYTTVFDKNEWQQFESSLENQYVGIGVRVGTSASGFYVDEVFAGSPAEKAGLKRLDTFVAVDGKSVSGLKLDDLVARVTGKEGTTVQLTMNRGGKQVDVRVARAQIQLPVVTSQYFPGPGIGYMSVADFSSTADEAFADQLKALKARGLKSLVLDLRYNPGGRLDTAEAIAKQFIKEGVLIHTRDHDNVDHPVLIQDGTEADFPVYILVNAYSASAAEVLSGALEDYGVGQLVGTKTFGKGSVQQLFSLADGSVLKMTVEEYYTPDHRKVNGVGLIPQHVVEDPAAQLIAALELAGLKQADLSFDDSTMTVNGQTFRTGVAARKDGNRLYVSSRFLAALVGQPIDWDAKAGAVVIGGGSQAVRYPVSGSSSAMMVSGVSLIDLHDFSAKFPSLQWDGNASAPVHIHVSEGE